VNARRAVTLVAWRELHERLRSPVFIWSTVLLLALVGGSTALSSLVDTQKTYRLTAVSSAPQGFESALERAATPFDAKVSLAVAPSASTARRQLEAKETDAVLLLGSNRIAFRSAVDAKLAAIVDSAVSAVRHRVPPAPELRAVTLEPPRATPSDAEVTAALLGASLLLATLAVYGQWVLTGVVEEKANRVVEVILATVRPRHLLAGKVIGIGLLGLAQVALIGGLAATLIAVGVFDAPGSLGGSIALVIPWFALGYALYAVAYAAAGALAARTQDASSAGLPVTYAMLAMFLLGYVTLSVDDDGTLAQILTVFPLSAPLVLPARSVLAGVPIWQHGLAVVLVVATIYALVRLAGRVYGAGLLHSAARLDLRTALRIARPS